MASSTKVKKPANDEPSILEPIKLAEIAVHEQMPTMSALPPKADIDLTPACLSAPPAPFAVVRGNEMPCGHAIKARHQSKKARIV